MDIGIRLQANACLSILNIAMSISLSKSTAHLSLPLFFPSGAPLLVPERPRRRPGGERVRARPPPHQASVGRSRGAGIQARIRPIHTYNIHTIHTSSLTYSSHDAPNRLGLNTICTYASHPDQVWIQPPGVGGSIPRGGGDGGGAYPPPPPYGSSQCAGPGLSPPESRHTPRGQGDGAAAPSAGCAGEGLLLSPGLSGRWRQEMDRVIHGNALGGCLP